jgi:hypothetical protein
MRYVLPITRVIAACLCFVLSSFAEAQAQQLRGDELTEFKFNNLSLIERKFLQVTLKGYGLYNGPIDGDFDSEILLGLLLIGEVLGQQRFGRSGGYEIGHPQSLFLLFDELFSGRVFDLFPYPDQMLYQSFR